MKEPKHCSCGRPLSYLYPICGRYLEKDGPKVCEICFQAGKIEKPPGLRVGKKVGRLTRRAP
jgi:hypothetical protein